MKKAAIWKKAAACAVALAFLLSACGAGSAAKNESTYAEEPYSSHSSGQSAGSSSYDYAAEDGYEEDWEDSEEEMAVAAAEDSGADAGSGDGGSAKQGAGDVEQADLESSNRKIIYTGNVSLQSLEYDKSSQSIHDKISRYGGFIENEDTYNEDPYWYYSDRASRSRTRRNLNITARIPAEKFDAFMKDLENDGQVTNSSISARNISVSYATREASKKALEIEQERLLKMMEKAETVEDMIKVEKRLTEVERQLNDEKTQLSAMDRDVDFSTVYISLQEVFEYSEQVVEVTYGERLQRAFGRAIDGFVTFWQDLLLFVVETFPFLIMLAVVIVLLVRWHRRRRRRKLEEQARIEALRRQAAQQAGVPYQPADVPAKKEGRKWFFHRGKEKKDPGPAVPAGTPAPDSAAGPVAAPTAGNAAEDPGSGGSPAQSGMNGTQEAAKDPAPGAEAGPAAADKTENGAP